MKLYAGFDGGGSKTACFLADEQGQLLGQGIGGPSNYLFCGREVAGKSVRDALDGAFRAAGLEKQRLSCAFVGSAAILLGHGDFHAPFFREWIDTDRLFCDSDILPVWFGGAKGGEAVVAIAGTGSIAYGCTIEGFFRVGGWGPLLGDEGSGYDLGRRALQTAARMADGRMKAEPAFVQAVLDTYGVETPHELISAVKGEDSRSKIAACAKTVFALAETGSAAADKLLEETAEELSLLCRTAARKAGRETLPVVLTGGLSAGILPRLKKQLSSVIPLQMHPGLACAALALEKDGLRQAARRLLEEGTSC